MASKDSIREDAVNNKTSWYFTRLQVRAEKVKQMLLEIRGRDRKFSNTFILNYVKSRKSTSSGDFQPEC